MMVEKNHFCNSNMLQKQRKLYLELLKTLKLKGNKILFFQKEKTRNKLKKTKIHKQLQKAF